MAEGRTDMVLKTTFRPSNPARSKEKLESICPVVAMLANVRWNGFWWWNRGGPDRYTWGREIVKRAIGGRVNRKTTYARAIRCADVCGRILRPILLDSVGEPQLAKALRSLDPIRDRQSFLAAGRKLKRLGFKDRPQDLLDLGFTYELAVGSALRTFDHALANAFARNLAIPIARAYAAESARDAIAKHIEGLLEEFLPKPKTKRPMVLEAPAPLHPPNPPQLLLA
jgi:hypothetical protein